MIFTSKVFKLGHSKAIYIPKDTNKLLNEGKVYTFKVLLDGEKEPPKKVLINSDLSGIDIHFNNDKKLVFDQKLGMNVWK